MTIQFVECSTPISPPPRSKHLPLQIPLYLTNGPRPRQPECPHLSPGPREVLHSKARPHPNQQRPPFIQHIHPLPRRCNDIPILRNLQSIRYIILGEIYRSLLSQIGSVFAEIVGVNRTLACLVVGDTTGAREGDVAVKGTRVGDVNGAEGGREGDTVGLRECVFNEVDGARGGAEAVGGGGELWRCGGEVAEVSIVLSW